MQTNLKRGRRLAAMVLGAALALPTVALAQRYESLNEDKLDIDVKGQAGVSAITGEAAAITTPGASYGVAAGIDISEYIGVELGYLGSVYQTEEGVESDQFRILENGAQGLVSFSPEFGMLEPYAFGGVEVTRLSVQESEGSSTLVNDDTQVKVPVGLGVNLNIDRDGPADWIVGARGTYDATLESEAFTGLSDSASNQLTGSVIIGGRF